MRKSPSPMPCTPGALQAAAAQHQARRGRHSSGLAVARAGRAGARRLRLNVVAYWPGGSAVFPVGRKGQFHAWQQAAEALRAALQRIADDASKQRATRS